MTSGFVEPEARQVAPDGTKGLPSDFLSSRSQRADRVSG
jgi:hypothetical protein